MGVAPRLGVERGRRENLCVEQTLENHAGRRLWVRVGPYSLPCRSKKQNCYQPRSLFFLLAHRLLSSCGDRVLNHLRVISPVW